jgi:hypothetical protein
VRPQQRDKNLGQLMPINRRLRPMAEIPGHDKSFGADDCPVSLDAMRQVCSQRPNLREKQNITDSVRSCQAERLLQFSVDGIAYDLLAPVAKAVIVHIYAHGCRFIKSINCGFETAFDHGFGTSHNLGIALQSLKHVSLYVP